MIQLLHRMWQLMSSPRILALVSGVTFSIPAEARFVKQPDGTALFIENKGQITDLHLNRRTDIDYRLVSNGGPGIFISAGTIYYQFIREDSSQSAQEANNQPIQNGDHHHRDLKLASYRMDVELIGANKEAEVIASAPAAYYETYYLNGLNGAVAHTCNRITYKNIYPNIDWVVYTQDNRLKHEFVVRSGGNVADIQWRYAGATSLQMNTNGSLTATTPMGEVTEKAPVSWQAEGKPVASRFSVKGNIVTYVVDNYTGDLVIDPALSWATYYGGNEIDYSKAVANDVAGNVYLGGCSYSTESIATVGAYQQTCNTCAPLKPDCFITKFSNTGTRLWGTYLGGNDADHTVDITVDNTGNAVYICGYTKSATDITTPGAHRQDFISTYDNGFLVKFNTSGAREWGTYIAVGRANALVTDGSGNVYIGGESADADGIATTGTHKPISDGSTDGYIIKFNSFGVRDWGTYYGGTLADKIMSLAIDNENNIYACGNTKSTNIGGIATSGAHQPFYGGGTELGDGFIAKLNNTGNRLWGTYYGGAVDDMTNDIATDGLGNVIITGYTKSINNISSAGSHKFICGTGYEGILAKFNGSGVREWGTYFGGSFDDYGLTVTANKHTILLAGITSSPTGISTSDAYKAIYNSNIDGYFAHFNTWGTRLYSSYYGGPGDDYIGAASCDNAGNLYLAGSSTSNTDIATADAHDGTYAGTGITSPPDAMLIKFGGFSLGVDNQSIKKQTTISVLPNPTTGTVTFYAATPGTMSIATADGKTVWKQELPKGQNTLQLPATLAAGLYLCHYQCVGFPPATIKLVYQP